MHGATSEGNSAGISVSPATICWELYGRVRACVSRNNNAKISEEIAVTFPVSILNGIPRAISEPMSGKLLEEISVHIAEGISGKCYDKSTGRLS